MIVDGVGGLPHGRLTHIISVPLIVAVIVRSKSGGQHIFLMFVV